MGLDAAIAFVGVSDLARAGGFYGEILGLPLHDQRPYALVAIVGETTVRLTAVDRVVVAPYTVLGWRVADIRLEIDRLTGRGLRFERFPGLDQDPGGVWRAPAGALVAWFRDPDGNVLSLTQFA